MSNQETVEKHERDGFSPVSFAAGIGVASILTIGGAVYAVGRFNQEIDKASTEIERQRTALAEAYDQIDQNNRLIVDSFIINPIDCENGPFRGRTEVDLVEGQTVTVSGAKITSTKEGFETELPDGEKEIYSESVDVTSPQGDKRHLVSKRRLPPILQLEGEERYRISIISECANTSP